MSSRCAGGGTHVDHAHVDCGLHKGHDALPTRERARGSASEQHEVPHEAAAERFFLRIAAAAHREDVCGAALAPRKRLGKELILTNDTWLPGQKVDFTSP